MPKKLPLQSIKVGDFSDIQKLYLKALNRISYRPRTSHEIRVHLSQLPGSTSNLIDTVIKKLTSHRYLNDQDFATRFANQLLNRGKGPQAIKYALQKKGIPSSLINKTLNSLDPQSNLDQASKALTKKLASLRDLPLQKQRQRLYAFLRRRGFSHQIVSHLLSQIDATAQFE